MDLKGGNGISLFGTLSYIRTDLTESRWNKLFIKN